MSNAIVFDIETGPETSDVLRKFFHYDETGVKGYDLIGKIFDEKSVKCGNMKDPEKIAEKIEKARADFESAQKAAQTAVANGEMAAWEEFRSKAPRNALCGRVLAVGYFYKTWKEPLVIDHIGSRHDEKELIEYALTNFETILRAGGRIIGHNIFNFDLPFLVRRAFRFGIPIPHVVAKEMTAYSSQYIIDTMRIWQCGDRREMVRLDDLAKFFSTTEKNGSGALFHKLYNGTPEQRIAALDYLRNDVQMTVEIAEKLGVYSR